MSEKKRWEELDMAGPGTAMFIKYWGFKETISQLCTFPSLVSQSAPIIILLSTSPDHFPYFP